MPANDILSRFAPVSMARQASDPQGFAAELGRSFREFGFAAISDHGLDPARIDRSYAKAAQFFALP
ncbi:MAG: isopenicillin N synthase-like dioxygenase, partial [Maricaulis sp.]